MKKYITLFGVIKTEFDAHCQGNGDKWGHNESLLQIFVSRGKAEAFLLGLTQMSRYQWWATVINSSSNEEEFMDLHELELITPAGSLIDEDKLKQVVRGGQHMRLDSGRTYSIVERKVKNLHNYRKAFMRWPYRVNPYQEGADEYPFHDKRVW